MTAKRKPSAARKRSRSRATSTAKKNTIKDPGTTLRELWLAGLGAVAATGEAAGEIVETLVEKGRETEPKLSSRAEDLIEETRTRATRIAQEVGERANEAFDGAMRRLGVSERKQSKNVLHRLGDLAEAIL